MAAVQHGRAVEVAGLVGPYAAGAQDGSLGEGGGHVLLGAFALGGGHQRPALHAGVGTAAQADPVRPSGEFGDEALGDALLDDEPGARGADLAAVHEGGVERLVDGGVEAFLGGAGVGEDDVGVLAAEFEGDLLDGLGGRAHHLRTAGETAGEGHEVDVRVGREARSDGVAGAGDQVRHAGRQAGLHQQTDEGHRGQRGDLAGLEHEGVAGGEGGGDLPGGLEERVVPGGDQGADADGFVDDDAVDVGGAGIDHAARALAGDEVGEVEEGVGDAVHVHAALFQRLARVAALQQRDAFAVAVQQDGGAAQQRGPLQHGGPGPLPAVEGRAGGADGRVGVRGAALRDDGEDRGVRRVEDLSGGS